ncbi:hypothetical protein M9H77_17603 [Catharanthus roseus]|uniref:Uncharacterized protein n=1 Tax=Catharanthus roseus TaxID=4058 RepID=A0ACC0B523_CATRO|nr:hypothetical protein M9H77_17603 [Catharanthus roseus]
MDRKIGDIGPLAHESSVSDVVDLIGGRDDNVEEDDNFINTSWSQYASSTTAQFMPTLGVVSLSLIMQHQLIMILPTVTHGVLPLPRSDEGPDGFGQSLLSLSHLLHRTDPLLLMPDYLSLRHHPLLFGPSPPLVGLGHPLLELQRLNLRSQSFVESSVAATRFRLIFQSRLGAPYDSWTTLPQTVRDMWFAEFSARDGFDAITMKRYGQLIHNVRIASKKTPWIPQDVYDGL